MKKILLTLILASEANIAMAGWTLVDESFDGSALIYSDLDSIQKIEDNIRMWSLGDFRTAKDFGGIQFLSSKYLKEYDCNKEQTRMLDFTLFSANMGEGEVVYSNSGSDNWEPIVPGSVAKALWEIACKKAP